MMNNEQIMFLFPEGFPIVPPGVIHGNPNPLVQAYLNSWREGKISMEAAYCGIIHCLTKTIDQLEGFISSSPLKVPEPTLVETNETEAIPQENSCKSTPDKVEQESPTGIQEPTVDDKT